MNGSPYLDKEKKHLIGIGRRNKIQIVGQHYNRIIPVKNQPYNDSNPYSLTIHRQSSTPFIQRTQIDTNRDTQTETSSQKSKRIMRSNMLRKASKPNLSGSRANLSSSRISEREGSIHKVQSINRRNSPHLGPQKMRNQQQENQRMVFIEEQNHQLKEQNKRLKEYIKEIQQRHKEQLQQINSKMQHLYQMHESIQKEVEIEKSEWHAYINQQPIHLNPHQHKQKNYNYNYNYNIMMTNENLKHFTTQEASKQ